MYKTIAGDSWDLIAYRVLGSEKYAPDLINANPEHIATFIFKAGEELNIPEIKVTTEPILPWQ